MLHFLRVRKISVELSSRKWTPPVHKKAKVLVTGAAWLLTSQVLVCGHYKCRALEGRLRELAHAL